jgi:hypothetical protein
VRVWIEIAGDALPVEDTVNQSGVELLTTKERNVSVR